MNGTTIPVKGITGKRAQDLDERDAFRLIEMLRAELGNDRRLTQLTDALINITTEG